MVKSTLAAETLAASDAIDNAYYMGEILSELIFLGKKNIPIKLIVDNKSLYDNINSMRCVNEKRLRIDVAAIRELVAENRLELKWVQTNHQVADVLTKKGVNPLKLNNILKQGFC